jgi:hypothetical protein
VLFYNIKGGVSGEQYKIGGKTYKTDVSSALTIKLIMG